KTDHFWNLKCNALLRPRLRIAFTTVPKLWSVQPSAVQCRHRTQAASRTGHATGVSNRALFSADTAHKLSAGQATLLECPTERCSVQTPHTSCQPDRPRYWSVQPSAVQCRHRTQAASRTGHVTGVSNRALFSADTAHKLPAGQATLLECPTERCSVQTPHTRCQPRYWSVRTLYM
ncbi:hypothetical protein BaRGS_00036579, partial [Batillaria attramentaria]